ncbi:transporter substrate-binding domain-containing protein [Paenibacillus hodogayensis]|uniref:Transporter substrate-binding domain-containing protein n=1 Tax=Paenibacillus hodogayensis TaxID=279208 RepID=A0ABV5VRA2_9BACL
MKPISLLAVLSAAVALVLTSGCAGGSAGTTANAGNPSKASAPQTPAPEKKTVKIAINSSPNPPYSYVDDKNQPIGYTIDYLKELEKKLPQYEFKYEAMDQDAQLIGTDLGKYALAANYFFRNPEREQKYLYPQHEFGYSVTSLIVKSDRTDIRSLDDMVGKKLTPMTPTNGLRNMIKDYNLKHPGKEIKIEDIDKITIADRLKMVNDGKYDADFVNVHNFDDTNKQLKLDLKVGAVVSKEPLYVLLNKKETELAERIDAATAELTKDGTLSKLAEKWFSVDLFKSLEQVGEGYKFRNAK